MKVTTYISKFLKSKGIDTVFELQGGMITRIIDELYLQGDIRIVSMHHEQAAAFAVDAYARSTNKPGVALATSGPGATNLITGIGSCFFDSVPAIFITGQVNLNEQKGDKNTRQIGFQETDIIRIIKPITKAAYAIKNANEIPAVFEDAYQIATEGRPGPVVIDIPMNLQLSEIEDEAFLLSKKNHAPQKEEIDSFIDELFLALKNSKKPLILAGRGVRASGSIKLFEGVIEKFDLLVVTSLLGFDSISYNNPNRVGFIGTYGNRWANYALSNCDVLLVLGSRLDLRQTGADVESFKKGKKIFHVDIEEAELNNRITDCFVLKSDLKDFFGQALNLHKFTLDISLWKKKIEEKYKEKNDIDELNNISGINPNIFIHQLSKVSKQAKVITTDVGNNQMWAAQSYELEKDQLFLSSGGMGAMGYSLPAAIGSCIASENSPVIAITGDGGFQINIQELETIKRNNLPVKIIVLNNHCLGMIRQFQDSYFESRYQSTVWEYGSPDFVAVAKAYGIDGVSINTNDEIAFGLDQLWSKRNEPFLLNVTIDIHTNVFPKLVFGNPLSKMDPEL
ncbi:MAG: thiamine pyrophosphate-binding protein [Bacteroidales bacterium]